MERLTYSAGNEHNPGNPFGKNVLVIDGEAARLEHTDAAGTKAWTGKVPPAVVERLWAALARGGFPVVAKHPVPAGATVRMLEVGEGAARKAAFVEWRAATKQPGYDEAFQILDSIVRTMSGDTIKVIHQPLPDVVTSCAPA
jgi:hypothetical protein